MTNRLLAMATTLLGVATCFGAYEYPWYVNPTLRFRVDNDLAAGVAPCSVDAAGEWLVMANDASGATNLRTITTDTVLGRDITSDDIKFGCDTTNRISGGVICNRFTHTGSGRSTDYGLSSAPLVAVDAANGRYLAANADLSAVRLFNLNRDKWGVGEGAANAPLAVTASDTADAGCLAFGSDGATLWSNAKSGEARGSLTTWTLTGATLTKGAAFATGLAAASGFGVYALDGADYAVVGEGDGTAATKGRVVLVKASDGTVTTLIDDAANLTGGIVSVKMSQADYFRPRVCVLLDTGDVVVYYYRKEKGTCHWSATFTNAQLLALCQAPYAASAAKVTQFAVSASGEVALVGYLPTSGAAAEGKPTFAFLYHTATPWTYYAAGAAGNPCSTNGACITDGKWVLTMQAYTTARIGTKNETGSAYDGDYMGEVLDLSAGYATDSANASKTYDYNMDNNYALGNKGGKGPRVILPPSRQNAWVQFTKEWNCTDYYEEVVIDFDRKTGWAPWANLFINMKRVVINCPKMTQVQEKSLYTCNTYHRYGSASRWEDFNFPVAYTFGTKAISYCLAAGKLTLPLVQTIGANAFYNDYNMTEVALSENKNLLTSVGEYAFGLEDGQAGSLKRVVLGCKAGCAIEKRAFYKQPLEEIVFTGAKPTVNGSSGWERWCDEKECQLTFVVPRNAEWEAVINGKYTLLTDAERQAFHVAHPGRYVPFGVLSADAMGSSLKQYVAYLDDTGYCSLKIERDDFFADDGVTVTPDHAAASDGTYLKGTKVTLTAEPGATGTFRKWYGGPFASDDETAKNATVEVTLDEDTWLYCRIVHPWTLASDQKTLSNGNFTLNCSVDNAGNHTLKVAGNGYCGLYADSDSGYGVCDMGGDILLAGDATKWTIRGLNSGGGMFCSQRGGKGNARALIMPETVESIPDYQFLHGTLNGWFGRSYETLIFDCPCAAGGVGSGWLTCGQYRLDHVILRLPKLTYIRNDANFWNVPMRETRLDWWNLASVNEIASKALAGYDWSHCCGLARGALKLPSLRTVARANSRSALQTLMGCTEIFLGGATKATTVTSLADYAFADSTSLEKVTLHNDPAMTVGTKPLSGCTSLTEIVLTGKPLTSETPFANLLSSMTAAETKPMKVYVSKFNGWAARPAWLDAPTEDERAEAPGEEVLGVYRGGATSPSGKALVVHRASPFDPKGMGVWVR